MTNTDIKFNRYMIFAWDEYWNSCPIQQCISSSDDKDFCEDLISDLRIRDEFAETNFCIFDRIEGEIIKLKLLTKEEKVLAIMAQAGRQNEILKELSSSLLLKK